MANTIALTEKTFEATVKQGGTLFIDFWADWCEPCLEFAPLYEAAAAKNKGVLFGKLDVDASEALADDFYIESVPTLIAIRDGVIVAREEGALSEEELRTLIAGVAELDMNEVRAYLDAEDAAEAEAAAKKKAKAKAKKSAPKKAAKATKPAAKKAKAAKPAAKKARAKKPAPKKAAKAKKPAAKKAGKAKKR